MLKPGCLLLVTFLFCVACGNDTIPGRGNIVEGALHTDSAIRQGRVLQTANSDTLLHFAEDFELRSEVAGDKRGIVYSHIFKAYYYWLHAANYPAAMRLCVQNLADAERWKINKAIPELYSIMANLHKENGNYPQAFANCKNALSAARANNDTAEIISALGEHAMFTHGFYRKNRRPQDDHTSLQLNLEALAMAEANPKYEEMRIRFYNNIAQTYKEHKQYNKALQYVAKAIVLAEKYNKPRSLTFAYNWLGEALYYSGKHAEGEAALKKAMTIAQKVHLPYREMEIADAMHWCYLSTKNYEPAIACLRRFTDMRDSLQISKNEKQLNELQVKYESAKKDRRITALNQQNQASTRTIWLTLGMLTFVIALGGVILYQYQIIKKKNHLMKATNGRLNEALVRIANIQSHHIRQPLASIMGLMNVIKAHNYETDKDVLQKMDTVANDLDQRVRDVISYAEVEE